MLNSRLKQVLFVLCLCILGSELIFGENPGQLPVVAVTGNSSLVRPLNQDPTALSKLYSNLGTKTDLYDSNLGWIVFGPKTGFQQWIAMPFTPKADATVKVLKLAIGNEGGTQTVTVLFATNASGIPGKTLRKWHVQNLFAWGTCCALDLAKDQTGISVRKGHLYWIVAKTDGTNEDAQDVWAYTWNHITGNIAYNVGAGWLPLPGQPLAAYAVLGTVP